LICEGDEQVNVSPAQMVDEKRLVEFYTHGNNTLKTSSSIEFAIVNRSDRR